MLGPLMVGIAGPTLTAEEKAYLQHPAIGGVILFTRNYQSLTQLYALTAEIKALREPSLLIAVDQEAGTTLSEVLLYCPLQWIFMMQNRQSKLGTPWGGN